MTPLGGRSWDLFVRATAIVGLVGIPVILFVPGSQPLVWLALAGIPANSPLSPILPTVWDPLLVQVAKFASPASVTAVAVGIYMYMEYINWHVYGWVLSWQKFDGLRSHHWVRWGTRAFSKAPFATVLVFAASPLPFWVVRSLAILKRYPIGRFMVATAIGRVPRFFMYAWLGAAFRVPLTVLIPVMGGTTVAIVMTRLFRGQPVVANEILDETEHRRAGAVPNSATGTGTTGSAPMLVDSME